VECAGLVAVDVLRPENPFAARTGFATAFQREPGECGSRSTGLRLEIDLDFGEERDSFTLRCVERVNRSLGGFAGDGDAGGAGVLNEVSLGSGVGLFGWL